MEGLPPGKPIQGLSVESYTKEVVAEHIKLLIDGGFLEGDSRRSNKGVHNVVRGLTWEGHNFLDNAKNDTVWKKAMAEAKDKGMSLSMTVLNGLLTKAAQKYMGLD